MPLPEAIWIERQTSLPSAALLAVFPSAAMNCATSTHDGVTTVKAQWVPPPGATVELPIGPFSVSLQHTGDAVELCVPAFLAAFITGLPPATVERGLAIWRLGKGHYGPVGVRGLASFTLVI